MLGREGLGMRLVCAVCVCDKLCVQPVNSVPVLYVSIQSEIHAHCVQCSVLTLSACVSLLHMSHSVSPHYVLHSTTCEVNEYLQNSVFLLGLFWVVQHLVWCTT